VVVVLLTMILLLPTGCGPSAEDLAYQRSLNDLLSKADVLAKEGSKIAQSAEASGAISADIAREYRTTRDEWLELQSAADALEPTPRFSGVHTQLLRFIEARIDAIDAILEVPPDLDRYIERLEYSMQVMTEMRSLYPF